MLQFVQLVIKNIIRNKRRTLLTLVALAVSIFVFISLLSINNGMDILIKNSASDSIITVFEKNRACPLTSNLPESYENEIKTIPNVKSTTSELRYMTKYKADSDEVSIIGINADQFRNYKDIEIDSTEYKQFSQEKKAAIVGNEIATYYNWEVGDDIILKDGRISFTIRGIYSKPHSLWDSMIIVHKSYLQDVLGREGKISFVSVMVDTSENADSVTTSIDSMYVNSQAPTKSQSELEFLAVAMEEMAAMKEIFSLMAFLSIFVTLVVSANSIAMSTRERTREIGVLMSLGFKRGQVLSLILMESIIISMLGGIIGVTVAVILLAGGPMLEHGLVVPPLIISPLIIAEGLVASLIVGVLGGLLPAFGASRLDIVDSLREVE